MHFNSHELCGAYIISWDKYLILFTFMHTGPIPTDIRLGTSDCYSGKQQTGSVSDPADHLHQNYTKIYIRQKLCHHFIVFIMPKAIEGMK